MEVLIRRYPNRKLYDTLSSHYINYSDVIQLIQKGATVKVIDNKTREDVTHFILRQILLKKEKEFLVNLSEPMLTEAIKTGHRVEAV